MKVTNNSLVNPNYMGRTAVKHFFSKALLNSSTMVLIKSPINQRKLADWCFRLADLILISRKYKCYWNVLTKYSEITWENLRRNLYYLLMHEY